MSADSLPTGGPGSGFVVRLVDDNGRQLWRAPRRHKLTYSLGADVAYLPYTTADTACECIPLDDDVVAVRLILGRSSFGPGVVVNCAIATVSNSINDYVNPTGGAGWSTITWNTDGIDSNAVNPPAGPRGEQTRRAVPQGPLIDPNTGSTAAWAPDFSDWVGLKPVGPAQQGSKRALMVRLCFEPGPSLRRPGSYFNGWTGNTAMNLGNDWAGHIVGNDRVTGMPFINNAGPLNGGGPILMVQVLSCSAGIVVMTAGDSKMKGHTTAGMNHWNNQVWCRWPSIDKASSRVPYAPASCAWGGNTSQTFDAVSYNLLEAIDPSIFVIMGYSANDTFNTWWRAAYPRALMLARMASKLGAIPILTGPYPDTGGLQKNIPTLPVAFAARSTIMESSGNGYIAIDPISIGGEAAVPPDTGYNGSGYNGGINPLFGDLPFNPPHFNDLGNEAMATVMQPLIRALAGVSLGATSDLN